MIDNIFGEMMEADQRLKQYQLDRVGVKHHCQIEPRVPQPDQPITLVLTTSGQLPFDAARCLYATSNAATPNSIVDLRPDGATWEPIEWGYIRRWSVTLPPQPAGTLLRYQLAARLSGTAEWIYADNQARSAHDATEFAIGIDRVAAAPAWSRRAIVYHVFLDRFYPGADRAWLQPDNLAGFFGGTLRGVIDQLAYIQDLGFNTLWLSPVFASPSHHGYDATDLYQVEPRYGTNADLIELIAAAHARGLRVLLDFVANHWSHTHATFQSALTDPHSPYHDWYTWPHWPDDYDTYLDVRTLPKLNLKRGSEARAYLLECAAYWLQQGVDGYRLDHANGPSHDFWIDFRRACRAVKPDCWVFGEIIHSAETQLTYAGRLDGTLDFLLARALRDTFAQNQWNLAEFEAFLSAHEAYFPEDFSRPAFLDNHDMNRFLFLSDGNTAQLKLAALVMFTLAAPPIVYYGTEVGVTQARPIHQGEHGVFEEARQPMKWGRDQDADLHRYFRRLIALRQKHAMLQSGERRVIHLNADDGTYAYVRDGDGERVVVAVNLSSQTRVLRLPVQLESHALDQLNQAVVTVAADFVEVTLSAQSGAFIA